MANRTSQKCVRWYYSGNFKGFTMKQPKLDHLQNELKLYQQQQKTH